MKWYDEAVFYHIYPLGPVSYTHLEKEQKQFSREKEVSREAEERFLTGTELFLQEINLFQLFQ